MNREVGAMKKFIITVDTEGDNLWEWRRDDPITTDNAKYIGSFQLLCEEYGFKPVYLVNYEMAQSDLLVDLLTRKSNEGKCEIGMHLHAWNSPPEYEIPLIYDGCPYITEYPECVIREKHLFLKSYIIERFGIVPVSYRSGRWSTNGILFQVLEDLGFLVDCSISPGITYKGNIGRSVPNGNNYKGEKNRIRRLNKHLLEIPLTSCRKRSLNGKSVKSRLYHLIKGQNLWLRPALNSFEEMVRLVKIIEHQNIGFLQFMIHSSELMPGGSPYCKSEEDVEKLYERMIKLFEYLKDGYEGVTLAEYYNMVIKDY